MNRKERVETLLNEAFSPAHLDVSDESHKHAGHAGARPEGETHYKVVMTSEILKGLSRVAQHQKVYAALDSELQGGHAIHALSMELSNGS